MEKLESVIDKVAEVMKKEIESGDAIKKAMIATLEEQGFTRIQAQYITTKAYEKISS